MNTQPEALRLADALETNIWDGVCTSDERNKAAAELRRLHAVNTELLEACKTLAGLPDTENWIATLNAAVQQARTAIAKATGEQA